MSTKRDLTWERIEPGYYHLRGTDLEIANMRGQSVRYTGLLLRPWHVRVRVGQGARTVAEVETKVDAQAKALTLYRERSRRKAKAPDQCPRCGGAIAVGDDIALSAQGFWAHADPDCDAELRTRS